MRRTHGGKACIVQREGDVFGAARNVLHTHEALARHGANGRQQQRIEGTEVVLDPSREVVTLLRELGHGGNVRSGPPVCKTLF